jgi:hypothetical protein
MSGVSWQNEPNYGVGIGTANPTDMSAQSERDLGITH